jgi:Tfp pilus assembly protein PilF
MRTKQYEVARPHVEVLLQAGFRPSRMHFALAQIAEAHGDTRTAITEYRLALQIEPGLAEARAALAKLGG